MPRELTVADHVTRSDRHLRVGNALIEAGDEWAAVCFFYSAYHLVKSALLSDPIFDDPTALSKIHPGLTPDHRFTSAHHGRQRPREVRAFGINELVLALYRPVTGAYERLHQGSIEVRYKHGLVLALPTLKDAVLGLRERHDAGEINAANMRAGL